jgi:hypothetical protein
MFQADNGAVLAYPNKGGGQWGDVLALRLEGKEAFYALKMLWFGGDPEFHDISVADPVLKAQRYLRRRGDVVILDNVRYWKSDESLGTTEIVPYPRGREMLGFYRTDDGCLIYLSAEPLDFLRTTYRVYIGPGQAMRRLAVFEVETRIGTTYITTEDGEELILPAYDSPEHGLRWGFIGRQNWIKQLDPDLYEINETERGVTITKK